MTDISLVVVDDHQFVREMLDLLLKGDKDITVVGLAADAEQAIVLAREHRPDIIMMDIDMPGLICFDAARTILSFHSAARFIFFSAFAHDHYLDQALDVGARGYLTKGDDTAQVVAAIRTVADGGVAFSEGILAQLVLDAGGVRLAENHRSRVSALTPREREVLTYVARGKSKKAIADIMSVSVKTVESHTQNLMGKLAIHDRVELARYAFREGIERP